MKVFSIQQAKGGMPVRDESSWGYGSKVGGYASWRKLSIGYGANSLSAMAKCVFFFEKLTIVFNQEMENRTVVAHKTGKGVKFPMRTNVMYRTRYWLIFSLDLLSPITIILLGITATWPYYTSSALRTCI